MKGLRDWGFRRTGYASGKPLARRDPDPRHADGHGSARPSATGATLRCGAVIRRNSSCSRAPSRRGRAFAGRGRHGRHLYPAVTDEGRAVWRRPRGLERLRRGVPRLDRRRRAVREGVGAIPVAVLVAVRRGTRGHLGAHQTEESRAIPKKDRVPLGFSISFPSWTSPVRPRSPALFQRRRTAHVSRAA